MLIFKVPLTLDTLLVIPGLLLVMLNGTWVVLFLGLVGARFRDIPPVMQSLVQVLFFVTPIVWMAKSLSQHGHHYLFVQLNLASYFVAVVRSPLLGQAPTAMVWDVVILTAIVGWLMTFILYAKKYRRVVYWL